MALVLELPGGVSLNLAHLVLDFTGTLSRDGALLPGVAGRIRKIAKRMRVTVMTADTFGTAANSLRGLPVQVRFVETGAEKARRVRKLGCRLVAAVGNGRNDAAMVRIAALGIAVVGPEGAAGELVRAADVVVRDVRDAFDLLLNPLRLKATLRA
jgi:soluble P-type ATPase